MIGQTVSHYKILERLGEGGMGVVYKAQDTHLDRPVALKFLPPHLGTDKDARARFIQEAKSASSLEHTNICNIHDIDETDDGRLFIAMSCYEGESLKDKIERGPLPVEEVVDYTIQIAQGLSLAHEAGIIHRDIKPGNVMITSRGVVKIVDFGLAKMAETSLTKTDKTLGTAMYMSPEQARGEKTDHRTDIWSLGGVLYEMLTGKQPFRADYEQAVMYKLMNTDPEPITSIRPEVPAVLVNVVSKLIQKDPNERFSNMHALLDDLQAIQKQMIAADTTQENSEPSIAVLSFVDMSPQKDQEYFCDGMAEEIINALTQVRDLKVIARTSAFSFKGQNVDVREIGRKLDVEHLLEGSVRRAGDRLRITAQLIKTTDGSHIWAERYDKTLEDVFEIQDEISLAIVDSLKIKLLGNEKELILKRYTDNLEAYNLYLQGNYCFQKWTFDGFEKAIKFFNEAITLDKHYALAYAGLAEVHFFYAFFDITPPDEAAPTAKSYLKKALEIDEQLAEAHAALGFITTFYDWNWEDAKKEFERASVLNPNASVIHIRYAAFLSITGQHERSIREAKRARELDPLSSNINSLVGEFIWLAGQLDEAIEDLKHSITLDPNWYYSYLLLGVSYAGKSMFDEATQVFEKAVELSGDLGISLWHLSVTYYRTGRRTEADEVFERLKKKAKQQYVPPIFFSVIYRARGEMYQALQWLERACEVRDIYLPFCLPWPDELYRIPYDPDSTEILKNAGLLK